MTDKHSKQFFRPGSEKPEHLQNVFAFGRPASFSADGSKISNWDNVSNARHLLPCVYFEDEDTFITRLNTMAMNAEVHDVSCWCPSPEPGATTAGFIEFSEMEPYCGQRCVIEIDGEEKRVRWNSKMRIFHKYGVYDGTDKVYENKFEPQPWRSLRRGK